MSNNESITNEEKSKNIQSMFDNIADRYDFLNGMLSFTLDDGWRKKAIRLADIEDSHRVLDLACGTGDMILEIKKQHPLCHLFGGDFSINMLHYCKEKIPECPLSAADAHNLPYKDNSFDRITMAFGFRNVTDKPKGLSEFWRIIKPGGKVCILELTKPENPFISFFYKLYFMYILPAVAGLFSSKKAYKYLPESVYQFPSRQAYRQLIQNAGFKNIKFKSLLFGAVTIAVMEK